MNNPMLTTVSVPCTQCGSTAETAQRDREVQAASDPVCCDIRDLYQLDPREPFIRDAAVECFYCGGLTDKPFHIGSRAFCCKACELVMLDNPITSTAVTIRGAGNPLPAPALEQVREFIRASKAASTVRGYHHDWREFSDWCQCRNFAPLPASPETV